MFRKIRNRCKWLLSPEALQPKNHKAPAQKESLEELRDLSENQTLRPKRVSAFVCLLLRLT